MENKSPVIIDESNEGPEFLLKQVWIKSLTAEILALCGEMYPPPILCPRKTQEVVAHWAFAA